MQYVRLTDQLSMLGVVLTAKYVNTRRINAESVKERVSSLIGSWKSGRFMPLSQRPWSLNSYALPLVWYKCGSIDLRESDYTKLTSLIKSWMYGDLLEKPEELCLYRGRKQGGLGLHHLKSKATAILIRSFLNSCQSEVSQK